MNWTAMGEQPWCAASSYLLITVLYHLRNKCQILRLLLVSYSFSFMLQHIAASKGSVDCVLLLLDYGADPNRKGYKSISSSIFHQPNWFTFTSHLLLFEAYYWCLNPWFSFLWTSNVCNCVWSLTCNVASRNGNYLLLKTVWSCDLWRDLWRKRERWTEDANFMSLISLSVSLPLTNPCTHPCSKHNLDGWDQPISTKKCCKYLLGQGGPFKFLCNFFRIL